MAQNDTVLNQDLVGFSRMNLFVCCMPLGQFTNILIEKYFSVIVT